MSQVLNQTSHTPSTHSSIYGSDTLSVSTSPSLSFHSNLLSTELSTTHTASVSTSPSFSVHSNPISTETSTTHTLSVTSSGIQSSSDSLSDRSISPSPTAYQPQVSHSVSSLTYSLSYFSSYRTVTETLSGQTHTAPPLTNLMSSSSLLTSTSDSLLISVFSSSDHRVGLLSSVRSTLIPSTISAEILQTPPVSEINPTLSTSTLQNSVNYSSIKREIDQTTSVRNLDQTFLSPSSHVSETVTSTPSTGGHLRTSFSIRPEDQDILISTGTFLQTTVEATLPTISSFTASSAPISDMHLPSSSTQTTSKKIDSTLSILSDSVAIPLNSTFVSSMSQITSTSMPRLLTTVTTETIIVSTQYSFNTDMSPVMPESTSLNTNSSIFVYDSSTMDIMPSFTHSSCVSVSSHSPSERIPYSSQTTGIASSPITETNQAVFPGTLSLATTETSSRELIPSSPLPFYATSSVESTQSTLSDTISIETATFSSPNSTSLHPPVLDIQSTTLWNRTSVTEQPMSRSTTASLEVSITSGISHTLQPSFTGSSRVSQTPVPASIGTTGLDFRTSSGIVEFPQGPETVTISISLTSRILDRPVSLSISTITLSPTPSASAAATPSPTPVITIIGDLKFIFEFQGDCDRLILNAQLQIEFWQALIAILSIHSTVHIPTEKVKPEDLTCKPFQAVFILKHLDNSDYLKFTEQNFTITQVGIPILDDMSVIEYEVKSFQVIPVAEKVVDKPKEIVLEKEDIIIIVVAGALFGLLTSLCVAIACRECYRKRRAASFNLLDVPRVSLDMDDFTLTKIPRPKLIYGENNSATTAPTPVYNGNHNLRPKRLPVSDVNSAETLKIRPVSTDSIQVRIQPHPDGVVVGVTCTPPRSPTRDCSNSDHSSPRSEASEPAKQLLLKNGNPHYGLNNPNFESDDNLQGAKGRKFVINEDEDEALL